MPLFGDILNDLDQYLEKKWDVTTLTVEGFARMAERRDGWCKVNVYEDPTIPAEHTGA